MAALRFVVRTDVARSMNVAEPRFGRREKVRSRF
jgi:hypothetical protein